VRGAAGLSGVRMYVHTLQHTATHYTFGCVWCENTGWQTCIRYLAFRRDSQQKSPIISGSFAERDLQLKTSCVYNRESELAATG